MESVLPPSQLLWEEKQRANRARIAIERRQSVKGFLLILALIALTVAAATVLAHL